MKARSVGTFVQIGETAINLALVTDINFNPLGDEGVCLYFSRKRAGMLPIILKGDARLAFLDWWESETRATQAKQSYRIVFESGAVLVHDGEYKEDAWEGPSIDLAYFADQEEPVDESS